MILGIQTQYYTAVFYYLRVNRLYETCVIVVQYTCDSRNATEDLNTAVTSASIKTSIEV